MLYANGEKGRKKVLSFFLSLLEREIDVLVPKGE